MRYILASGSPRRKELLSKVVPEFEIIPAESEESCTKDEPSEIVEELSLQKASLVWLLLAKSKSKRLLTLSLRDV